MTALSDLLTNAKGKQSVDQLIEAARKRGVDIDTTARSNAYKALKGRHAKNPTDLVLRQWAEIFGVKVTEMREALGKPAGELGPWIPVGESGQLSQDIRDALDDLIKAIVKEGGGAHGAAATKEPDSGPGSTVIQFPEAPSEPDQGLAVASGDEGDVQLARQAAEQARRSRAEQEAAMKEMKDKQKRDKK